MVSVPYYSGSLCFFTLRLELLTESFAVVCHILPSRYYFECTINVSQSSHGAPSRLASIATCGQHVPFVLWAEGDIVAGGKIERVERAADVRSASAPRDFGGYLHIGQNAPGYSERSSVSRDARCHPPSRADNPHQHLEPLLPESVMLPLPLPGARA